MITLGELMVELSRMARGDRVAEQAYHASFDDGSGIVERDVLRVVVEIPRWRGRPEMINTRSLLATRSRAVADQVHAAIGESRAEFAIERGEAVLSVWDRQIDPDEIHRIQVAARTALEQAFGDVPGPVPALKVIRR